MKCRIVFPTLLHLTKVLFTTQLPLLVGIIETKLQILIPKETVDVAMLSLILSSLQNHTSSLNGSVHQVHNEMLLECTTKSSLMGLSGKLDIVAMEIKNGKPYFLLDDGTDHSANTLFCSAISETSTHMVSLIHITHQGGHGKLIKGYDVTIQNCCIEHDLMGHNRVVMSCVPAPPNHPFLELYMNVIMLILQY